jgi:hypothetical protein
MNTNWWGQATQFYSRKKEAIVQFDEKSTVVPKRQLGLKTKIFVLGVYALADS